MHVRSPIRVIGVTALFALTSCTSSQSKPTQPTDTTRTETKPTEATTTPTCDKQQPAPAGCRRSFTVAGTLFTERYVDAADMTWHVVEAGDTKNPAILFVHGVPESWYDWHKQMGSLAKNHHVVAFDLKGFGRSAHPQTVQSPSSNEYAASRVATEVSALLDQLALKRHVTLVSHDWGTIISSYLIAQDGERFAGWVRMSAPLGGDGDEIVTRNTQFSSFQNPEFCNAIAGSQGFVRLLYGYDGSLGINTAQAIPNSEVDRVEEEFRFDPATPVTMCRYYRDNPQISDPNFWATELVAMLQPFRGPVSLVQATQDTQQPLRWFSETPNRFSSRSVVLVPIEDSGHFMMFEQPDAVTAAIQSLVARQS